ncbi:MAG TPA: AsmA-like C-terminal region-containing protein [Burkholderiales bacterium]|nr:AsmA-like C-terminal region-containing protein [Burkholderiales bacterium]
MRVRSSLRRRLAYGLGFAVVAFAGLLALGGWLIDTPAVKAAIQQRLSAALGGQIAWEALELRLLPAPHGELRRVRVEIPGAVSARADQVDAYLRLWPLLRGHPEIASLSVSRPEVRIAEPGGAQKEDAPIDPLAAYRRAIEPVAQALQKFAPDTDFRIESAAIDLAGMGLELRDLNVALRTTRDGAELDLDASSNFWKRLRVRGRVEYADLSAHGTLRVDEVALHKDLPAATLSAQLRTDAKTAIECDLEAALGSLLPEAKAKLSLPAGGKPAEVDARLSRIDLVQAVAFARRNVSGLEVIESVEGRLSANVRLSLGEPWRASVDVFESDASARLAGLPWKLSAHAAQIAASEKQVDVRGLRGTLGGSSFSEVAARIELGKQPRLSAASGRATLQLEQWFPWLQKQLPLEEINALTGNVEVALQRMALRFDRSAEVSFDAVATPRQVSATLKALPAPVSVTGGSLQVSAAQVRMDRLAVAMLDASALVSGTVTTKGPKLELALAEGALGEKIVQWALARAEVPARLEPRTPLRFAAKRIAWAPQAPLEADASIDFDGGPAVAAVLAWQPDKLELRRLAIKDARSDAVLGATIGGDVLQASFSGTLYGRSLASMLRKPRAGVQGDLGVARGKLVLKGHRKAPEQSTAEGRLQVEALDLSQLVGAKVLLQSGDFSADGESLRIAQARLEWEDQSVSLNGVLRRTAQGPVIDARLESPGVVVERLLAAEKSATAGEPKQSKLWPLPVTGQVDVRAGFVQYQHYKIAPLEGSLKLERERASLQVKEARMCGVSFPLTSEALPDSFAFATQITMKDQPIEQAMRCLTGETVEITGNADLRADLRSRGKVEDLIRNLTGTAQADLRKGTIKKFALIGNILSVLSLRNLVSPQSAKEGAFAYRSLSAKGRFEGGAFLIEESFFDSNAARLAATGTVDLLGANSRLDVLVGLLTTVDRVAGAIPLIGDVFGGSLTALPVAVSGDIRDPRVVPLGPHAVTDRLLGIFERTLKLPGKLVVPGSATTD